MSRAQRNSFGEKKAEIRHGGWKGTVGLGEEYRISTGLAFGAGCDTAKMRGLVTLVRFQSPKDSYMHLGQILCSQQGSFPQQHWECRPAPYHPSFLSCWSPLPAWPVQPGLLINPIASETSCWQSAIRQLLTTFAAGPLSIGSLQHPQLTQPHHPTILGQSD